MMGAGLSPVPARTGLLRYALDGRATSIRGGAR